MFTDLDDSRLFFLSESTTLQQFEEMITKELPKIGKSLLFYVNDGQKDVLVEDRQLNFLQVSQLENLKIKNGK